MWKNSNQASQYLTSIVDATIKGDVSTLKKIFESEKNPEILKGASFSFAPPRQLSRNSKEFIPCKELTLLHIAAYFDNLEVFIFLTMHGLIIRSPSASSYYPLHYACVGNAKEVAAYILDQDPEEAKLDLEVQYQPLNLATYANSPEILKMLFAKGADLQSPKNVAGRPFDQALRSRNFDCLLILLENRCKTDVSVSGLTPLMLAIVSGMVDAVGPLLNLKGNPNFVNIHGNSALSCACMMEQEDVVKLLCSRMETVEIPSTDIKRPSIAAAAVHSNNVEILRTVLEKGCEVNRFDFKGKLPVHALLGTKDQQTAVEMLTLLIENGYNVNIRQNENSLRFMEELVLKCIVQDCYKLVECLLQHGADAKLKMPNGKTLLECVEKYKNSSDQREKRFYNLFKSFYPELQ